jgi:hypothetical protein
MEKSVPRNAVRASLSNGGFNSGPIHSQELVVSAIRSLWGTLHWQHSLLHMKKSMLELPIFKA